MYITLEGIDGCGTTTQIELIAKELESKGHKTVTTKEPTDGTIGRIARQYLQQSDISEEVHALLFAADRLEHDQHIQDWCRQGLITIGDRGLGSSYVYQSLTCGEDFAVAINQKAMVPDLTIVIKIAVRTAVDRLKSRGSMDRFENEDFLIRVSDGYNRLPKQMNNVVFVNGEQSIEKVTESCMGHILKTMSSNLLQSPF